MINTHNCTSRPTSENITARVSLFSLGFWVASRIGASSYISWVERNIKKIPLSVRRILSLSSLVSTPSIYIGEWEVVAEWIPFEADKNLSPRSVSMCHIVSVVRFGKGGRAEMGLVIGVL